jgi:hypothetical protein
MPWPIRHQPGERPGRYQDTARFTAEDPRELVIAALSCPICLTGEGVGWSEGRWGHQHYLDCACSVCNFRWHLRVTFEQLLRVAALTIHRRLS